MLCLVHIDGQKSKELNIRSCSGTCDVRVVNPEGTCYLACRLLLIDVCGAHPTPSNLPHINFRSSAAVYQHSGIEHALL